MPLEDAHDVATLTQLRDALNLEQTTLGQMKVRAQEAADRRLDFIQGKLNPLEEDRDRVKAEIGQKKWTSNPAPKMTYAERIAALKAEQADLENALALLASLDFSTSLPAARSGGGRGRGRGSGSGRGRVGSGGDGAAAADEQRSLF